jgi:hypothetical protein
LTIRTLRGPGDRPGRFAFPERVLVEAEPLFDVHPDD